MKFHIALNFSASLFLSLASINYAILRDRFSFLFSCSLASLCLLMALLEMKREK